MVEAKFVKDYAPFKGWTGFAVRGAFGAVLKNLLCPEPSKSCSTCPAARNCYYAYIFETRSTLMPDAQIAAKSGKSGVTKLYVVTPAYVKGNKLTYSITLFGAKAIKAEPHIIMAIMGMGVEGLGYDPLKAERRKFTIDKIVASDILGNKHQVYDKNQGYNYRIQKAVEENKPILAYFEEKAQKIIDSRPEKLMVVFKTPTKLRRQGRTLTKPTLQDIIAHVARKYSLLAHYHNLGPPLTPKKAKQLQETAQNATLISYKYRRHQLQKHSLEQQIERKLGLFITGTYTYALKPKIWRSKNTKLLLQLLLLAEHTNVGALTTAGCGKIELYWR